MTAFNLGMRPGQRLLEIMAHMLVEGGVFLVGDLVARARPQGVGLVDGLVLVGRDLSALLLVPAFLLHHDRLDDVVGVLAHQLAQLPTAEQVFLAFAQVQGDLGAALGLVDRLDLILAGSVAGH